MRPLRLLLHAMMIPNIIIAFMLFKTAPNPIDPEAGMQPRDYYMAVAVLFISLFLLFYGSFLSRQLKRVELTKRKALAWAFIGTLAVVDTAMIYYLSSFKGTSEAIIS